MTTENSAIIVSVPAETWKRRLALKAEASALAKRIKELDETLGLPSAEEVGRPAQILVVDGNGDIQGKGSIFHFGGSVTPPGWRMRVS